MPHRIVREEIELLDRVLEGLARAPRRSGRAEEAARRELERLREALRTGAESKDRAAIYDAWRRNSILLEQLESGRSGGDVDPRAPYFGHLRTRTEDGERDVCIGKATRLESGLRIVDWRHAPISRLFYRYRQGEDFEETFAGRPMRGRVVARRVVKISDAALEQVDSPEGSFRRRPDRSGWERVRAQTRHLGGGGVAVHAPASTAGRRLGAGDASLMRADKRLPEITGLLDPDQFELITRPAEGFLVIRGAAGTGKTTVALHRIAYLALEDPGLDSGRTLVLVFSRALQRYVEHVLPALGLHRVAIRTYAEWSHHQRRRHFPELPEAVREDTPNLIQAMKLHPALLRALEAEVAAEEGPSDGEQAREDWLNVLVNAERLWQQFGADPDARFSRADVEEFALWHRRRHEALADVLAGEPESQVELDPEDDALLLRAWQLRVGPLRAGGRRPLRYRHIAVDEVQDFSPLEIQVALGCLATPASITLAGDTQQHVTRAGGFASWTELLRAIELPGTALDTLRVPYRSTREIFAFSQALLGELREDGDDDDAVGAPRSGPPVELFRFVDRGACVAFLAEALEQLRIDQPLAAVALLTESEEVSQAYAGGFAQTDLQVRRVVDYGFSFQPGIEIAEVAQAKGLEFDYVVLLDVDPERYPDDSFNRRLLHVGATRAIQQLWITCVGVPSAIVHGACDELAPFG